MYQYCDCNRIQVFKGAIGDCLQKHFCYSGWNSLHILIAIIKLSGLNLFIYSVEGLGPRNVCPSVLIVFPTCLSMYVLAYLCAPWSRKHDTSSARSHTLCRQRQANINKPIFLPGIGYCSTFTNCAIKFSPRWMTHVVASHPCIFCMFCLVNTQITSSLEKSYVHELCSDWHAPYTVFIAPYSLSRENLLRFI